MRLKNYIPLGVKKYIINRIENRNFNIEKKQFIELIAKKNKKNKIWILDACDHFNLGDQAILMAELEFLKDNFNEYEVIPVGLGKYERYITDLKKYIVEEDYIFLHGGGNFGNYYKNAEKIRRDIIKRFPNNKVILFPQTIYFTQDKEGNEELLKSIDIYSAHKNLILVAREKTSYKKMCENFKNNKVILTPDIVMYLNRSNLKTNRSGALLCCRDDMEGVLSKSDKIELENQLKHVFTDVRITDTVGGNNFKAVENKFNEFRESKLVITDRIHGMIFAAITGTPCIALSNYNYKVKGTYEWIKHLGYIKFANNINDIPKLIEEVKGIGHVKYDNSFAVKEYQQILEIINS